MVKHNLLRALKQSIRSAFAYFLGLVIILAGVPVFILLVSPFIVYRRFLFYSAKYFNPDLGKMLNARGSIPAFENVYKSPRCKLVTAAVLEGCPTLDDICNGMSSAMKTTDPETGEILYPELTQNITKWMGYWFWKPIPNFSAKDHIHYIDNHETPLTFEEADRVLKEESLIAFTKDKALWKLMLFTNYIPHESDQYAQSELRYSFLVFCVHHSLVDGFSVIKLAHKVCQVNYNDPTVSRESLKDPFYRKIWNAVKFFLRIPHDLGELVFEQIVLPKKIWKSDGIKSFQKVVDVDDKLKAKNTESYNGVASEMIPFARIKEIKNLHNVTSTAVIVAAIAGTIRSNFFKESHKIPPNIQLSLPFPLENHPNKLRNHMTGGTLALPIGDPDPLKRLFKINNAIFKLKASTLPLIMGWLGVILGSFPPTLLKMLSKHAENAHIVFLSSFPGPSEEIQLFRNCTWKDNFWMCSIMSGTKVLAFAFTTYSGYGRLLVGADPSVLPTNREATDVIQGFLGQLDVLQNTTREQQTV